MKITEVLKEHAESDFQVREVIPYEEAAEILGVTEARVAQLAGWGGRLMPGIYTDEIGNTRRGVTYASVIQLLGQKRQRRA